MHVGLDHMSTCLQEDSQWYPALLPKWVSKPNFRVKDGSNTQCREGLILQATQVESGEPVCSPTIPVNSPLPPVLPKCRLKERFTVFYMLRFSCISVSACSPSRWLHARGSRRIRPVKFTTRLVLCFLSEGGVAVASQGWAPPGDLVGGRCLHASMFGLGFWREGEMYSLIAQGSLKADHQRSGCLWRWGDRSMVQLL